MTFLMTRLKFIGKKALIALISLIVSYIPVRIVFQIAGNYNVSLFLLFWFVMFLAVFMGYGYVRYGRLNPLTTDDNIHKFKTIVENFGKKGIISIPLENISHLWTENDGKEKVVKITMDKVYSIWRDDYVITIQNNSGAIFNHTEIKSFFKRLQDLFSEHLDRTTENNMPDNEKQEFFIMYRTILFILHNLDENGHCPSVVVSSRNDKFRPSEPDVAKSVKSVDDIKSDYELFAENVSLLQHSIHVANNIIDLILKNKSELYQKVMLPAAIVAALAHDIGKEPGLYDSAHYSMMVHPEISALFLKRFFSTASFSSVVDVENNKNIAAVLFAVENHHIRTVDPKSVDAGKLELLKLLKEADKKARKDEKREALIKMRIQSESNGNSTGDGDGNGSSGEGGDTIDNQIQKDNDPKRLQQKVKKKQPEEVKSAVLDVVNAITAMEKDKKEMLKNIKQSAKTENHTDTGRLMFKYPDFEDALLYRPRDAKDTLSGFQQENYICDWLNNETINAMLEIIEERINYVVYRQVGEQEIPIYNVFTVKDVIFLTVKVVPSLIHYFAKKYNDTVVLNADKQMRRNLTLSVVDKLKDIELVSRKDIKEGYFGGRFILERKKYDSNDIIEEIKGFYLPLNFFSFVKIFDKDIPYYENRKFNPQYDKNGFLKTISSYRWDTTKKS